jgi:hypothetical protein
MPVDIHHLSGSVFAPHNFWGGLCGEKIFFLKAPGAIFLHAPGKASSLARCGGVPAVRPPVAAQLSLSFSKGESLDRQPVKFV